MVVVKRQLHPEASHQAFTVSLEGTLAYHRQHRRHPLQGPSTNGRASLFEATESSVTETIMPTVSVKASSGELYARLGGGAHLFMRRVQYVHPEVYFADHPPTDKQLVSPQVTAVLDGGLPITTRLKAIVQYGRRWTWHPGPGEDRPWAAIRNDTHLLSLGLLVRLAGQ